MRLHYYKDKNGNFGDDLNMWLWDRLLPNVFDHSQDEWVSVIGSLIHSDMPNGRKKVVFSSGAGCGHAPSGFGTTDWDVICVRGPLTEKVFDLPDGTGITDGAILLALLTECEPVPLEERTDIVFMPHHSSLEYADWPKICEDAGITYISPSQDSHKTIQQLRYAKLVLADAMHAAIVADTLRTPWIAVKATPEPNDFKWTDWCLSMGLNYSPVSISSSNPMEALTRLIYKGYYPGGKSPEEIMKNYKRKMMGSNNKKWIYERKIRRASSRIMRSLYNALNCTNIFKKLEQNMHAKAASDLLSLIEVKPQLSDNAIFEMKLSTMQEKLKELKKHA